MNSKINHLNLIKFANKNNLKMYIDNYNISIPLVALISSKGIQFEKIIQIEGFKTVYLYKNSYHNEICLLINEYEDFITKFIEESKKTEDILDTLLSIGESTIYDNSSNSYDDFGYDEEFIDFVKTKEKQLQIITPIETIPKETYSYIYIIECHNDLEHFYKIGKTNSTTNKRFSSSKAMPYEYVVLAEIKTNIENILKFESELHKSQSGYTYKPNVEFAGWTECFSELDWLTLQPIIDTYRR